MDNVTHTLFAATLARTRLRQAGPGAMATLLLASNAPDIDIVTAWTGGSVGYLAAHRGPTHGLIGIVPLAVVTAALVRLCTGRGDFRRLVAVGLIGVLLHVAMDLPTSYGTRLLSPFRETWYALDWLPIIDIYLLCLLGCGLLAAHLYSSSRSRVVALVFLLIGAHYLIRATAHDRAVSVAANDAPPEACVDRTVARWNERSPRVKNETPTASPAPASRCDARVAALPSFLSPFRWRLVRQTGEGYTLHDLDLFGREARATLRVPNEDNPLVARAREAPTARVFLTFARFPAARVMRQPNGAVIVRWDDVRFVRGLPISGGSEISASRPFVVLVTLDRGGRIIDERLGL